MKNLKYKDWEQKKIEIINEINSIPDRKFNKNIFIEKIKINIPKNSTNKNEVIDCLSSVGKGAGSMFINGNKSSWGPTIEQQKKHLIEILNLIEIKKFILLKNVIDFLIKKIDWKEIIKFILTLVALLDKIQKFPQKIIIWFKNLI